VDRLHTDLPLPHVGWNSVEWTARASRDPVLAGVGGGAPRFFYNAHSYAVQGWDDADLLGRCEYDVPFASVVGRGNVWGIQFHPEKSQEEGLRLLGNFARL
ncbi:MAG: imidazole glycerol phosphate synthase subunit HisH, partial [Gemmatimonadota bacterium]|nr:imidazole glycerol phosphate synthase subunit HisH [Gemmatimonadota bacterium]